MTFRRVLAASFCIAGVLSASSIAKADQITWNTWTSDSTGTMGSVGVTFVSDGQNSDVENVISWGPKSTYADGVIVNNAPDISNNIMQLLGGDLVVNTVTFDAPVLNPVMAIFSLGSVASPAEFDFINTTPIFVAGGPSNEYGGSAIVVNGSVVSGNEGNGTVEFLGTFSKISWTNPVQENWYGFNVGSGGGNQAVPEPSTFALLGLGGVGLTIGAIRRRRTAV